MVAMGINIDKTLVELFEIVSKSATDSMLYALINMHKKLNEIKEQFDIGTIEDYINIKNKSDKREYENVNIKVKSTEGGTEASIVLTSDETYTGLLTEVRDINEEKALFEIRFSSITPDDITEIARFVVQASQIADIDIQEKMIYNKQELLNSVELVNALMNATGTLIRIYYHLDEDHELMWP